MTHLLKLASLSLAAVLLTACNDAREPQSADVVEAAPEEVVAAEATPAPIDLTSLAAILAGDHRSVENTSRDASRHPVETLEFFGLKPDMKVVEIWPGGGWYLEVIAPYLRTSGTYYAAGFDQDTTSDYARGSIDRLAAKLAARPDLYGSVVVTELAKGKLEIAPESSADMVLTFRNVHNWMDGETDFPAQVFAGMYRALKPGGVLGVVEHRGIADQPQDPKAESGYVTEKQVIDLAEAAGFQLANRSEINANPLDTKDYSGGVWTLPPSLRLGEVDREKYSAIGESDRMTLKFVKPAETGMAAAGASSPAKP